MFILLIGENKLLFFKIFIYFNSVTRIKQPGIFPLIFQL